MRTLYNLFLITLLSFSFAFGQEKEEQTKKTQSRQQKLEEAKKTSQEWIEALKKLDAFFPDDKPLAPIAEAEVAGFIKTAEEMEKWAAEDEKQQAESEKRLADIKAKADDLEKKDRVRCVEMKAGLAAGKISVEIRDLWVKMAANCDKRYPPEPIKK